MQRIQPAYEGPHRGRFCAETREVPLSKTNLLSLDTIGEYAFFIAKHNTKEKWDALVLALVDKSAVQYTESQRPAFTAQGERSQIRIISQTNYPSLSPLTPQELQTQNGIAYVGVILHYQIELTRDGVPTVVSSPSLYTPYLFYWENMKEQMETTYKGLKSKIGNSPDRARVERNLASVNQSIAIQTQTWKQQSGQMTIHYIPNNELPVARGEGGHVPLILE